MIKYRTILCERSRWATKHANKRTSIRNKKLARDGYRGSAEHATDEKDLLQLDVSLWDADRALIDHQMAVNSRTADKVYKEFDLLTAKLAEHGVLPASQAPINHEFDPHFCNPASRRAHGQVCKLRAQRKKLINDAREVKAKLASKGATDGAYMRRQYHRARSAQRQLLAYRRTLMRRQPAREETFAERRARENIAKREAVRQSTLIETGKIPEPVEPDLLDQRQLPTVSRGEPIGPPETFLQKWMREQEERNAEQNQT